MDQETLDYLKQIGDQIVELMKKVNSKKRLTHLELAKKYDQFRGVLLNINKECLVHFDQPIFKLDEVIQYLVPESDYGISWKERRDFLLLRIYEIGFDFLKQFKEEIEEETQIDDLEGDD